MQKCFIKKSTKKVGNAGEDKAVDYLKANGYKIVARNWQKRGGEIDIIAEQGEVLVFVEVKTLPSGNIEMLAHELNIRKQKRILETSKRFLQNNRQYNDSIIRFDVLVVDMPGFSPVYHIKDAFLELV
ncbi:MAG: YraN family protein [Treponema sp.]|nr:YraN family protein [Treponema sp.]